MSGHSESRHGAAGPPAGRDVYLEDIALDEAQARFRVALTAAEALRPLPAESIALADALGRVTSAPVWARTSNPSYHAAAMDGVAVRAEGTVGARETAPKRLRLGAEARWIDTGDPMPADFDAVVMIEDVHDAGDGTIEISAAVAPWQHVRPLGEDIVATEMVVPGGQRLRPVDLGAIAAAGHATVAVRRRPRIALIPTGTELVAPGQPTARGEIVEFNSLILAGIAEAWGAETVRLPIQSDRFADIRRAVVEGLAAADIVVVNAGSSAGSEDFTSRVIDDVGTLLVHGVAIRPGHPVALGLAGNHPVIGIPGYPVSAALTFELFVGPVVHALLGTAAPVPATLQARLARKIVSPMGEDEFVRVKVGKVGRQVIAAPLERGAGVIMSLVRADGIARIPRFSEGVTAGSTIDVELLRDATGIEHTIVAIGSHDPALDLLANEIAQRHPPAGLASSNAGSYGGLLALRRGEAHLAGCHLIDPATGVYNEAAVREVLAGRHVWLVNFARRVQGLIVAADNPKSIGAIEDLARDDVTFVNRQRGSGTRLLLDHQLKSLDIATDAIRGYDREQFTHLSVAADVASGSADVGLGVLAAARALNLEFVPVLTERFDLVIPDAHYQSPVLAPLLEVLRDAAFAAAVAAMGGYEVEDMGAVLAELGA